LSCLVDKFKNNGGKSITPGRKLVVMPGQKGGVFSLAQAQQPSGFDFAQSDSDAAQQMDAILMESEMCSI